MNTKKIEIEIQRKEGKTYFRFKIDKKITEMYQKQSQETRESTAWTGLSFYYCPAILATQSYTSLLNRYDLTDDFGQPLVYRNKLNIAWIRSVGGEGMIEFQESIPFAELSQMTRNAIQFLKAYFEDYIKDCTITGSLSVEV